MSQSPSDDDVLRFIVASFPSVWALELMLAIKRDRRAWNHQELVVTLRGSELAVGKAVDALIAAGIASMEGRAIIYLPVNSSVEDCLERVEQLYRTHPNRVRREIVANSASGAKAFANAFKLRRDQSD